LEEPKLSNRFRFVPPYRNAGLEAIHIRKGGNRKHLALRINVIYLSLPSVKLRNLSFAKRLFLSQTS